MSRVVIWVKDERPTRHFLSWHGPCHLSAFSPLQYFSKQGSWQRAPHRTHRPLSLPLSDPSVLCSSDLLASGPALSWVIASLEHAGKKKSGVGFCVVSGQPPLQPHASGWSALNSGSAPEALDRAHLNPAP